MSNNDSNSFSFPGVFQVVNSISSLLPDLQHFWPVRQQSKTFTPTGASDTPPSLPLPSTFTLKRRTPDDETSTWLTVKRMRRGGAEAVVQARHDDRSSTEGARAIMNQADNQRSGAVRVASGDDVGTDNEVMRQAREGMVEKRRVAKEQVIRKVEHWREGIQEPTSLTDLPAEIRNAIYALVTQEGVFLPSRAISLKGGGRSAGRLICKGGLAAVSRQIRKEYLGQVYFAARKINIHVVNFNFANFVTFLNRLDNVDMQSLPTIAQPSARKLTVALKITPGCPENPEFLQTWLLRCESAEKKGIDLHLCYHAKGPSYEVEKLKARLGKSLLKLEEGRAYDELLKILSALRRAKITRR